MVSIILIKLPYRGRKFWQNLLLWQITRVPEQLWCTAGSGALNSEWLITDNCPQSGFYPSCNGGKTGFYPSCNGAKLKRKNGKEEWQGRDELVSSSK